MMNSGKIIKRWGPVIWLFPRTARQKSQDEAVPLGVAPSGDPVADARDVWEVV